MITQTWTMTNDFTARVRFTQTDSVLRHDLVYEVYYGFTLPVSYGFHLKQLM